MKKMVGVVCGHSNEFRSFMCHEIKGAETNNFGVRSVYEFWIDNTLFFLVTGVHKLRGLQGYDLKYYGTFGSRDDLNEIREAHEANMRARGMD